MIHIYCYYSFYYRNIVLVLRPLSGDLLITINIKQMQQSFIFLPNQTFARSIDISIATVSLPNPLTLTKQTHRLELAARLNPIGSMTTAAIHTHVQHDFVDL